MAKLLTDPITANNMSEYLKTSDFQLELDVFHSLARYIQPSHGGTYTDPVTKKDRQYDIRAEFVHRNCYLKLAIECKNLKPNFPLLISRVPRLPHESYHEVSLGRAHSHPVEGGDIYRADNRMFKSGETVGKSATQVGKTLFEKKPQIVDSDSETYEKWSQAIASANELIAKSGHSSRGHAGVNATTIFPILVIPDGTLWATDYSAEGVLIEPPRLTEKCSLFLEKTVIVKYIKYTITHLLIFTKTAFDTYLGKLDDKHSDEWESLFPPVERLPIYETTGKLP